MMKYLMISITAALLVAITYIGLSLLLNQPTTVHKGNNQASIEFVDIDYDDAACKPITNQINELLQKPQTCETAADCSITYFGCPFGCQSTLNLTHKNTIETLIEQRNAVCSTKCKYRCKSDGVKKIPSCVNRQCVAIEAIESATDIKKFIKDTHPLKQ
jgi:hypothetical protein